MWLISVIELNGNTHLIRLFWHDYYYNLEFTCAYGLWVGLVMKVLSFLKLREAIRMFECPFFWFFLEKFIYLTL